VRNSVIDNQKMSIENAHSVYLVWGRLLFAYQILLYYQNSTYKVLFYLESSAVYDNMKYLHRLVNVAHWLSAVLTFLPFCVYNCLHKLQISVPKFRQ